MDDIHDCLHIVIPPQLALDRLQDELEDLANELMVEIRLLDE